MNFAQAALGVNIYGFLRLTFVLWYLANISIWIRILFIWFESSLGLYWASSLGLWVFIKNFGFLHFWIISCLVLKILPLKNAFDCNNFYFLRLCIVRASKSLPFLHQQPKISKRGKTSRRVSINIVTETFLRECWINKLNDTIQCYEHLTSWGTQSLTRLKLWKKGANTQ